LGLGKAMTYMNHYSIRLSSTIGSILFPVFCYSHEHLSTNYLNSLARMKGQIKRLASEPKVVNEYDAIIKVQLMGIRN
jgi:hypothetical protein